MRFFFGNSYSDVPVITQAVVAVSVDVETMVIETRFAGYASACVGLGVLDFDPAATMASSATFQRLACRASRIWGMPV
jgi:hypothetical protein